MVERERCRGEVEVKVIAELKAFAFVLDKWKFDGNLLTPAIATSIVLRQYVNCRFDK